MLPEQYEEAMSPEIDLYVERVAKRYIKKVDCTPIIGQKWLGESGGIPPFYSLS